MSEQESEMEKANKIIKSSFEVLVGALMVAFLLAILSVIIWFLVLVWSAIFNVQI